MRKKTSYRLAFACPPQFGGFFASAHSGFRNFCREHKEVEQVRFEGSSWLKPNALNYVAVDGAVGLFPDRQPPRIPAKIALVNISHAWKVPMQASVINDDWAVGRMAFECLSRDSNRDLGVFSLKRPWHPIERAIAFRSHARKRGRACTVRFLESSPVESNEALHGYFDSIKAQMRRFLESLTLPAAVFCPADDIASHLVDEALELGLTVPKDLKVLGCDNQRNVQDEALVPLSSIELSGYDIGWRSAEKLLCILQGKSSSFVDKVAPRFVVERLSTGRMQFSPVIQKAVHVLRREFRENVEVGELIVRLGVSRRKFEILFQRETGYSPYQYLLFLRLDRASQLLSQSSLNVSEIALETGFGDFRSLSTAFRRHFGVSPRHWKKVHLGVAPAMRLPAQLHSV